MKVLLLLIILALFIIFKKERFDLSDDVRTISADRWIDILKPNRNYINQIDYWSNAPQIDLERAIQNSPITSDDVE